MSTTPDPSMPGLAAKAFDYAYAYKLHPLGETVARTEKCVLLSDAEAALAAMETFKQEWKALAEAYFAENVALRERLEGAEKLQFLMANGWNVSKVPPASYLTDEANALYAWRCERTEPPFCRSEGEARRIWTGPTPLAALMASVEDLSIDFPAIAHLAASKGAAA